VLAFKLLAKHLQGICRCRTSSAALIDCVSSWLFERFQACYWQHTITIKYLLSKIAQDLHNASLLPHCRAMCWVSMACCMR
jgi:hypothetical protein